MKKQLNGNFLFLFFLLLFEIFYSLVMKKHCKLILITYMLGIKRKCIRIKENMKKQLNGNFLFLFFLLLF